jgi:hypothetical protein
MKPLFLLIHFLLALATLSSHAAPKQIRVFVALCDNKSQGIIPVGEKIGNGDNPDANLYWGCSDGFGSLFSRSKLWKVTDSRKDVSTTILRRLSLHHTSADLDLVADAYRGSQIQQCLKDFEAAAASGKFDLVAFIGHNGLMDFQLPPPPTTKGNKTDVAVLCCLSDKYFSPRLTANGCRPILMTSQLMYPGAFLLQAAIESWNSGASTASIRSAAAAAYAKNQHISLKAASGVFANLPPSPQPSPQPSSPAPSP